MKNPKVVILSLVAIACLVLAFIHDWLWIIPAAIIMAYNQKELFKKIKN